MNKILIISLQGLGNTVMFEHIFRKIIEKGNNNEIHFVISNNGSYQFVRSLHYEYDKIKFYIWDETRSDICNIIKLIIDLRKISFDTAYAVHPNGKRENLLLFFTKAKSKKILRRPGGFFQLFNFLHPHANLADISLHDVENNAILFNIPIHDIENTKVRINVGEQLIIGLHVGSKSASKRWDIIKYAKLVKLLNSSFSCKFFLIAGKEEENLIKTLIEILKKEEVFVDLKLIVGLDFNELVSKMRSLTLLVGNDSSIAHISSLLGIPTVVIWSFAQFHHVSPYGAGNIVIKKNYECIPCYDFMSSYINDCKYHLRCIRDITVNEVFEIIKVYISCLQTHKIPTIKDFSNLKFISSIEIMKNGCIILSLV
jgi:ADP-heptose:LPS heptosyltransferase